MKQIVLFVGACGYKYNVNGGEIAKCRIIDKYLHEKARVHTIDTYWEKKSVLQGLFNYSIGRFTKLVRILYWGRKSEVIVICSSYVTYLKPIKTIRCLNRTFLFGIGGRVPAILLGQTTDTKMLNELAAIFVESQSMVSDFLSKGVSTAKYLPNCKFLPGYQEPSFEQESCLKLFFIGKICREKGCDDLIMAVNELNQNGVHCSLSLYGFADSAFPIDKMTNDFITYEGVIDLVGDLASYEKLRKYDLFVFPSKWEGEGFAGALVDAMALGKPVIASRHNAIPDIVNDKETGLLFETGNVSELKEKIMFFYKNREQLSLYGKRALTESGKYDVKTVLDSVLGEYL